MVPQVLTQLHLNGTAPRHHGLLAHALPDDHDGVMQGPLRLLHELVCTTPKHNGHGLALNTLSEQVEPLPAHLPLLEQATCAQAFRGDLADGGEDLCVGGFAHTAHVIDMHTSSTEEATVSEVLRRKITNCKLGQDDLCPASDALLQLVINDLPLGINDALVLQWVLEPDLGIVLLCLQFQLNVKAQDLWVNVLLRHLFKASIGERLLEGNSIHQERVRERTPLHFLDPNQR
mmetsp:Transcript_125401/g.217406  ORF Transcript_125401/g.217406 Transcript_125401/m.217406 type:complete len:232 (-) Transcript_125401:633-1328(-)